MPRRRRQPGAVARDTGRARHAQQFRMQAVLDAQRAEVDDPLRQLAHQQRQPLHHAQRQGRHLVQQLQEGFAIEHRHHAVFQRQHVGRARLAIDGRDVSHHFAGRGVAESDLPAVGGVGRDAHPAVDEEEHLAAVLRPQQQGLPGGHALPATGLRQAVQPRVVDRIEQRDATQGEAGACGQGHGQAARIMLGAA